MTTLVQIAKQIKKARRGGIKDYSIGKQLGISAAEVDRLAKGKRPGIEVSKRLGITPVCHVCKRKIMPKKEKVIAPLIGRDSNWFQFYKRKIK